MIPKRLFIRPVLLVFLAAFGQPVAAADTAETIVGIASQPKYAASLHERVVRIAAVPGAVPALQFLVSEAYRGNGRRELLPVFLTALGFVAEETDAEAIQALESIAYGSDEAYRREALFALLRIGGPPARRVIDQLRQERDEAIRQEVLDVIWQLRREQDLRYAERVLSQAAAADPESPFGQTLRGSTLSRLAIAHAVREAPGSPESLEALRAILERKEVAFFTVSGGLAQIWALHQLSTSGSSQAVRIVQDYVERVEGDTSLVDPMRVTALKALERLGRPLSRVQEKWLRENHRQAGSLILTLRAEDLGIEKPHGEGVQKPHSNLTEDIYE